MDSNRIIDQSYQTALSEYQHGRLAQAEELCRTILCLDETYSDAIHLLGMVLLGQGKVDDAIDHIRHAILLKPDDPQYFASLGLAMMTASRFPESADAYQAAIKIDPDFAEAYYNLGIVHRCDGQPELAIECYQKAIELRPGFPAAINNYAHLLRSIGRFEEAADACRRVIELDPNHVEARNNLAVTLKDLGLVDESLACLEEAIALNPENQILQSNRLYSLYYRAQDDPEFVHEHHCRWNETFAAPLMLADCSHQNDPSPDRRLKIGYVSPDFRQHCQAMFVLPLLANHDRKSYEITCYSNSTDVDTVTEEIKSFADHWRPIAGMSDDVVTSQIRADGIDILVDLTLHMGRNRLLAFARKSAPLQVTWLGYPGTTGVTAMDYRLTDPHLDPADEGDHFYAEQPIRLPDTFWCYDPRAAIEVGELPALSTRHITFGCLNNFCKVNTRTLMFWRRVLERISDSRLILLAPQGSARQRVLQLLAIDTHRVEFVDFQPRDAYLRTYRKIDICLDTFPYNGHTTSLDAMWMGVPVVSVCGRSAVSRAGLSMMSNLGMTDLVAHDEDEFVQIAARLAGDQTGLVAIRRSLRSKMQASPLMDARRFARNIESAYRGIWRNWCRNRNASCATMECVDSP